MTPPARVLVVGPGPRSQGGVWTVMSVMMRSSLGRRYRLRHIATHLDGAAPMKLGQAVLGLTRVALALARGTDLVWIHFSAGASSRRKAVVAGMCRAARTPYVLHSHSSRMEGYYRDASRAEKAMVRGMLGHAARVVTLGRVWERVLADIAPCRTELMMNPVDIPPIASGDPDGPVVCVGRLGEQKGSVVLAQAFAQVARAHPGHLLVLAGDGDPAPVVAAADEEGLADRVLVPGWLEAPQLGALLDGASVFALPSRAEGLPMSLIEAMARGLPCIATPVGGVPDLAEDDVHALMVPPDDVDALAAALSRLWEDPALAARLGAAARERVRALCDADAVADHMDRVFQDVLREHPPRRRRSLRRGRGR